MKINSRRVIIFVSILIILIVIGGVELFWANKLKANARYLIQVGDQPLKVELAASSQSRYRGLSGRSGLCQDCGMLFYFPEPEVQIFVMREMKFPLDIIFIAHGQIESLAANLPPEGVDYKNQYRSRGPVDYVLEVKAGYAAQNNIKVGDKVYGLNFK